MADHELVLKDPAAEVIDENFGDNALIFDANFWVQATAERGIRTIRSDIRYRIDDLFRENGIVIAFPQRNVHMDGAIVPRRESRSTGGTPPGLLWPVPRFSVHCGGQMDYT